MKGWLQAIGNWFDARLGIERRVDADAAPPGAPLARRRDGLVVRLRQCVADVLHDSDRDRHRPGLVYVPSADQAYTSLLYLDYEQPLGWFLRALHYYAGSGMVVMLLVHMTQVFLHGAYKYPRELTWVIGVLLLACTLGMFFSGPDPALGPGRLLGPGGGRFDGRTGAVHRALGRRHAAGRADHRRRFAQPLLHVARIHHPRRADDVLVGPLVAGAAVRRQRAAECRAQVVDPATYDASYHKELEEEGVPFLGDAMMKDILFSALAVTIVVVIAALVGPKGPTGPPDPRYPMPIPVPSGRSCGSLRCCR